jgi:predicted O-methyltransferase YrrM
LKYAVLNLPCESELNLQYTSKRVKTLAHPVYAWLGLRPFVGQHTAAEHAALQRWAQGRKTLVEIGVAEGVSALALREVMSSDGTIYLIDPYHLSRSRSLNFTKRAAHKIVESCSRGQAIWLEKFSQDVAKDWSAPIDLLVIDGDHSEGGVQRDWNDWCPFVKPGGIVIFHDARLFDGGWTNPNYGPVKLVDRLFRAAKQPGWQIVEEIHSLLVVEHQN